MSEVITLDSDEETGPVPGPSKASPAAAAMAYNPDNYRDLLGSGGGGQQARRPVPPLRAAAPLKKPNPIPPFGLFSQEQRPMLTSSEPHLSFGEVGRRLGEMWHALTEDGKNVYRQRAQELHRSRLAQWNKAQAAAMRQRGPAPASVMAARMQQQQQQQQQAPVARRTNGFTIFCSEMRRRPTIAALPQQQQSARLADAWKRTPIETRRRFEERAQRFNVQEIKKVAAMQAQVQGPVRGRGRGRASSVVPRISSVASLSPQRRAVSMSPASVNLPSSISISRVGEGASPVRRYQQNNPRIQQLPTGTSVQRQHQMRLLQQQQQQQLFRRGPGRPPTRGVSGGLLSRGGGHLRGGYGHIRPAGMGLQQQQHHHQQLLLAQSQNALLQQSGTKRFLPMNGQNLMGMSLAKRPRVSAPPPIDLSCFGRPATFGSLSPLDQLCRLCGISYKQIVCIYKISESLDLQSKLESCLGMSLDTEREKEGGYPNIVCKKCCEQLVLFSAFKDSVNQGLEKVHSFMQRRKAQERQNSILPDVDDDDVVPRPVNIKDEMHSAAEARGENDDEEEEEEVDPLNAPGNDNEEAFDFIVSTEDDDEGGGLDHDDIVAQEGDEEEEGEGGAGFLVLGEARSIADMDSVEEEGSPAEEEAAATSEATEKEEKGGEEKEGEKASGAQGEGESEEKGEKEKGKGESQPEDTNGKSQGEEEDSNSEHANSEEGAANAEAASAENGSSVKEQGETSEVMQSPAENVALEDTASQEALSTGLEDSSNSMQLLDEPSDSNYESDSGALAAQTGEAGAEDLGVDADANDLLEGDYTAQDVGDGDEAHLLEEDSHLLDEGTSQSGGETQDSSEEKTQDDAAKSDDANMQQIQQEEAGEEEMEQEQGEGEENLLEGYEVSDMHGAGGDAAMDEAQDREETSEVTSDFKEGVVQEEASEVPQASASEAREEEAVLAEEGSEVQQTSMSGAQEVHEQPSEEALPADASSVQEPAGTFDPSEMM